MQRDGQELSSSQLAKEIYEQPDALSRLLTRGWRDVEDAAARIRDFDPDWLVLAARGTSDNAARYAQYVFGAFNHLYAGLATPSLFTLYERPPQLGRALTIGISQSGQSPDVVSVIREAREQGGLTIAITNDDRSPLALTADICLPLHAGQEHSVAATKTYTNQLLLLAMLSQALDEDPVRRTELEGLPHLVEQALGMNLYIAKQVQDYKDCEHFCVVGRGFCYSTAHEIALKIKETCYVMADPYSGADLLHGPIALVDDDLPVILLATEGRSCASILELGEVLLERGARIIAISDRAELCSRAQTAIAIPSAPEWLAPIVTAPPGQEWARKLALARGIDPDRPRGLNKVTRTH